MKIESSLIKYLINEADTSDLDALVVWLEDPNNELIFENYVKTYFEVTLAMSQPDIDSIKRNLLSKIKKDQKPYYKYRISTITKYAALFLMLLGIGYIYNEFSVKSKTDDFQILIPKEEAITIELDNGVLQKIDTNVERQIVDVDGKIIAKQSKTKLSYTGSIDSDNLVYNTIHIPNGKRFDLILSDGTHVFLNSGTSLRYPVKFIKGITRDVFLKGEAYFEVTKDQSHPFNVHADDMKIRVLGTTFNVSHYSENSNINTVLVEGSVQISNDKSLIENNEEATILKPGFMAEWNRTDGDIAINNVDTRIYTAWTEGKLIFRNTPFLQIRKGLERHYNVTIKNTNLDLDKQLFDASFDTETIDEVLEAFAKSFAIDYKIINNQVIIE